MVYGRSIAIGGCLLATVILLSALIFYLSIGPCPKGTFACNNGKLCVPQRQICDKRRDCADGADEDPVECGMLYGSKAMTDKIIGNALQKQEKLNKTGTATTTTTTTAATEQNITVTESSAVEAPEEQSTVEGDEKQAVTDISVIQRNQSIENSSKNRATEQYDFCQVSTYPKDCSCKKGTIVYCYSPARLMQIPRITPEVTNLIIISNNLTLQRNDFVNLKNLRKLNLKNNSISQLPLGIFDGLEQLERLDLRHNTLTTLPHGIFRNLSSLQWLHLGANQLKSFPFMEHLVHTPKLEWLMLSANLLTLNNDKFPRMKVLYEIYLDSNRIEYIGEETFAMLHSLQLLNLNWNQITYIDERAFWGLKNLVELRLIGNPLKNLYGETFTRNIHLEALSLSDTQLLITRNLLQTLNVSYLDLAGISFEHIEFDAISAITNLKYIVFDRFYYCSMTPQVRMCRFNTDGVSSFRDLLTKPVLRYSAWIMATITITGNIMVLWGRFIYRDENIAVTMVIRNLALADILMGFYLITIGGLDYRYRNEYHRIALDWTTSWQCAALGVLAVTSSEVSMLILAFMSLERFLLIANPFRGHHRISPRNIFIALLCIWIMGVGIAVAPVILWHSSTKFYGTYSGTCFPLHIQEPYPLGWQYSAFMFLGVNLTLLLMIALLYTALLISIYRTRKATPLSLLDCEFAVRFFFIVLTDFLCWAPIIVVKIWVFFNYNISDDIYAWLVVFILPLNSAVNPLLYTFTTPKYRNQILLRGWKKITSHRRAEQQSNGLATTTATATASSNPDDSSGKAIPMAVNH